MRETRVQSLNQEDPLEKEMAPHSSTLAWKIPWMEEPGRLQSMGSQRVGHDWAISLSLHDKTTLRRTGKSREVRGRGASRSKALQDWGYQKQLRMAGKLVWSPLHCTVLAGEVIWVYLPRRWRKLCLGSRQSTRVGEPGSNTAHSGVLLPRTWPQGRSEGSSQAGSKRAWAGSSETFKFHFLPCGLVTSTAVFSILTHSWKWGFRSGDVVIYWSVSLKFIC